MIMKLIVSSMPVSGDLEHSSDLEKQYSNSHGPVHKLKLTDVAFQKYHPEIIGAACTSTGEHNRYSQLS